ncbi:hypothetical protein FSARC_5018 [Fusarium sarcochroum]|uniref:Uncharacterized protein n=1 Tax=Fusarium sarcochroum TaxID=1208366 RepID=A0A8H4XAP3_9HYPO|nr:hypothetical protein FSARC_5018 [Fusarium sarcochroum]
MSNESDEPLFVLEATLSEAVTDGGFYDTLHTENASVDDYERRSVIERTRGNIHSRVELMEVEHGTYDDDEGGDQATLLVFRFRFDPQRNSRRVIKARVNIEFMAAEPDGLVPIVEAIAPEERWTVVPTTDQESTTRGGQLNVGASGASLVNAGATASLEQTVSKDVTDATTVTGSINLGEGKNSGEPTVAVWNLLENQRRQTGVPDSVTVAVLLRREDAGRFNAKVTLEADVDWLSGLEHKIARVPLDDPVLFNPQMTSDKPKRGRSYGVQGLGGVDLYSLCEVRMAVEAHFAAGKKK